MKITVSEFVDTQLNVQMPISVQNCGFRLQCFKRSRAEPGFIGNIGKAVHHPSPLTCRCPLGVHLYLWSNRELLGFEDSRLFLSNFLNYEHDGKKAKLMYTLV